MYPDLVHTFSASLTLLDYFEQSIMGSRPNLVP